MPAPPLTHHDILALVEPFARRGRHVDLAASERHERRLVFKPRAREPSEPSREAARETLQLECPESGPYRLTRTLRRPDGIEADLRAQGRNVEALLAAVEAVPAEHQFLNGSGYVIARSYTLTGAEPGGRASLDFAHGTVHVENLVLSLNVPPVRGVAGDLTLSPTAHLALALPEDLLAVLGWNWARLVPGRQGWTSKLRLRGDADGRTRSAEEALVRAASHLATTMAEPPARYHEQLRAARWGVFFRRGIPTWNALAMVALAFAFAGFREEVPTAVWITLYHVPTLFVALSFLLQELPRFEIPPWPRQIRAASWSDGIGGRTTALAGAGRSRPQPGLPGA